MFIKSTESFFLIRDIVTINKDQGIVKWLVYGGNLLLIWLFSKMVFIPLGDSTLWVNCGDTHYLASCQVSVSKKGMLREICFFPLAVVISTLSEVCILRSIASSSFIKTTNLPVSISNIFVSNFMLIFKQVNLKFSKGGLGAMKHFKNILLVSKEGTNGKKALEKAVDVAKRNKARLTVVRVIERLPHDLQMLKTSLRGIDIQKLVIQEHLKQLNDAIAPFKKKDIQVNANVLIGKPFIEITKEILRNKHDLVITTAEGKGGLKEMLFGTTTMHLIRKCPSPVWAIKPGKKTKFERILAAVGPSNSDNKGKELNTKIMELATSIAKSEKGELHVIHTWELYSERILRNKSRIPDKEVDALLREIRKMHKNQFEELLSKYAPWIPEKQIHFLKGDAGELIPEIAKKKGIDLIVMGTVGRTGIDGLFIGNTAEEVLQRVDCSVLTVKPDSYVSPIKGD